MRSSALRMATLCALTGVLGAPSLAACSGNDTGVYKLNDKAGLVIGITSDLAAPEDFDAVQLDIAEGGNLIFSNRYDVAPNGLQLPATLTIFPSKDASALVTIVVTSFQNGTAKTVRRVVTTVPATRRALLEMPIEAACEGQVEAASDDEHTSSCESGSSCLGGSCESDEVSSRTLPDFPAHGDAASLPPGAVEL